jgi:hypothetical protein
MRKKVRKEVCCGTERHHNWGHHGCSCGCGGHSSLGPRFWTRKEKITWLEEYLEGLNDEVKATEERIAALKEEE